MPQLIPREMVRAGYISKSVLYSAALPFLVRLLFIFFRESGAASKMLAAYFGSKENSVQFRSCHATVDMYRGFCSYIKPADCLFSTIRLRPALHGGITFLVQANDIAGLCKRVIFLKFSLWLKMQLNGRVDMDCKSLEEYAGKLERNEETEITVDKDFFVGLIKEVVLRRRIIARKGKQKVSN